MTFLKVRPQRPVSRNFNHDIDSMHNIGSMFDNFFSGQSACHPNHQTFWPAVDVHESENDIRLTLEAPGAKKDDIKVTVKDRILTIEGKREPHTESTESKLLVNEIRSGSFSRSFTLPKTVDTEKIDADFQSGLLKVTLAKLEEIKPKEIDISVK